MIVALYQPGRTPAEIVSIQDAIQRIQKGPTGWLVARHLLDQPTRGQQDDRARFFGALAVIVKLNSERSVGPAAVRCSPANSPASSKLSDDEAREVLQNLLRWLVATPTDGSGTLSVHKLTQALVTYFIHFSHLWPHCIWHVLLCLDAQRCVPLDEVGDAPESAKLAARLGLPGLRVALAFVNTLVDDVGRTEMTSPQL